MARTLPVTLVEAAFASSTPVLFKALLTIRHASFETRRIVNDLVDLDVGGVTYRWFPFAAVLPVQDEEGPGGIRVTMANVPSVAAGFEVPIELVRLAAGGDDPPRADLRIVNVEDPTVAIEGWTFEDWAVRNSRYVGDVLTFDMQMENLQSVTLSSGTCTPGTTAGLY